MPDPRKREGGTIRSVPAKSGIGFEQFRERTESSVEDSRKQLQEFFLDLTNQVGEVREDLLNTPFPLAPSINDQMKALREFIGFPEELSVGEQALGFGVGSIKGIRGVPANIKLSGKKVPNINPKALEFGPKQKMELQKLVSETGQFTQTFSETKPGTRPARSYLEAQARVVQERKRIQTRVKEVQKDLDRLSIAEVNPLVPLTLIQEIAKKGLRAKASYDSGAPGPEGSGNFVIAFKSKDAVTNFNDEFVILPNPDGPILAVNFNSPTIKAELRPQFKEAFPNKFLADEIGEEFQPGELQRMAGETAKDAPPPDNFSYYNLKNFEDGLQVINKMLDIAKQ
jgi:hypothetical protein